MTPAISSGLQGYDRAEATVNAAAARIANYPATTVNPGATTPDSADLSSTAVSLLQGKNMATANLAAIHAADQMQKSVLDILG